VVQGHPPDLVLPVLDHLQSPLAAMVGQLVTVVLVALGHPRRLWAPHHPALPCDHLQGSQTPQVLCPLQLWLLLGLLALAHYPNQRLECQVLVMGRGLVPLLP
jgi:hypothetical protein